MRKPVLAAAALAALGGAFWMWRSPGDVAAATADYPLEEGLRWTYRGAGALTVVREIARTVEVDGRRYHEMTYALPLLGTRTLLMRHAPGGVVTLREGRDVPLLRFPMRPGDAWTIDLPGEAEVADCRVLGEEEIDFAGRRGRAVKLEVRRRSRSGVPVSIDHEWYAPGLGLVRMDVRMGVRASFVLDAFERAK